MLNKKLKKMVKSFASVCKSMPISHTSDEKAWRDFIIAAYPSRKKIQKSDIENELMANGWNEVDSQLVAEKFDSDVTLLSEFCKTTLGGLTV